MVYADNAATTKLDKDALAAMLPWLQDEYGNASQPYSFARKPKKALTDARATIAACIGAEPEEIYFTSGGTESDNWAIKGLIEPNDKHQTITSQIEHHAVLNACGDVIESKTVHDFKFCSCGSCAVDGGLDYLRRCGNLGDWEELSKVEKVEGNNALT